MICETCKFKKIVKVINSITGKSYSYPYCGIYMDSFRNLVDDTCKYYKKKEEELK